MIPVDQTTFGNPAGNCLNACAASIMECEIGDLPDLHAIETEGEWWEAFRDAVAARGWWVVWLHENWCDAVASLRPAGWSIMGGRSPRAPDDPDHPGHAVVALDGELVHDPHPSRDGIVGSVEDWMIFIPSVEAS